MYLKPSCISFCYVFTAIVQIISEKLLLWGGTTSGQCLFHGRQENETWLLQGGEPARAARAALGQNLCQGSSSSSQHSHGCRTGWPLLEAQVQHRLCLSPLLSQQMNHLDFSQNAF